MNRPYSVSIVKKYPVNYYLNEGKNLIHYLCDTSSIFFIDDYTLYKMSPITNFNTGQNINGTQPYFIIKKRDKYGYFFQTINDRTNGERLDADSLVAGNNLKQVNINYPSERDGYLSSGTVDDALAGLCIEKFSPMHKPSEDEPDTLFYFFSKKFPQIKYSFSKKLDSLKGMKLYKMRMFFKAGFSEANQKMLPDHEIVFELLPFHPGIPDDVMSLFNHYKRTHPE